MSFPTFDDGAPGALPLGTAASISSDFVAAMGADVAARAAAPAKKATSKRWCFTLNNPTADDIASFSPGTYGRCQLEIGANGTTHLQGFCVFATAHRLSGVRALNARCHWESMRGSLEDNERYVWKDDSAVSPPQRREWGARPAGQGARTDLKAAAELVVREGEVGLANAMPWMIMAYPTGVRRLAELRPLRPQAPPEPTWREWQSRLLEILSGDPHSRHIYWFTDYAGGAGKSTLLKWVVVSGKPRSATTLSGKVGDMGYGYKGEGIVFFDIARSVAENIRHLATFAEKLKDGVFFNPKYEAGLKVFAPPHVVFFSNSPPEADLWSADRLQHTVLSDAPSFSSSALPQQKRCADCGRGIEKGVRCTDCM